MKIIKINDNIKINIEMIYSLEYHNNNNDIIKWENDYKSYLDKFAQDPPILPISNTEVYRPIYGEKIDKDKMQLYSNELNAHIISIIGDRPEYIENYYVILSSGLKVNIDKSIYDIIDKYLDKFIIEN